MVDGSLGRPSRWPLRLGAPRKPGLSAVPEGPLAPAEVKALVAEARAVVPADGGQAEPPLPPDVLGYGVGAFPGGGEACSGLAHTGLMSLESARREAGQYAAAARNESFNPEHKTCGYEAVEIRRLDHG